MSRGASAGNQEHFSDAADRDRLIALKKVQKD
jgi:hypothetical protein